MKDRLDTYQFETGGGAESDTVHGVLEPTQLLLRHKRHELEDLLIHLVLKQHVHHDNIARHLTEEVLQVLKSTHRHVRKNVGSTHTDMSGRI